MIFQYSEAWAASDALAFRQGLFSPFPITIFQF